MPETKPPQPSLTERDPEQPLGAPGSALSELSRDPSSRKRFLTLVGAGGAAALAAVVAACGDDDKKESSGTTATQESTAAADSKNDLEIVNYALTLEYLEAQFYKEVVAAKLFKGAQQALLVQIGDAEQQHVDALIATAKQLGGTPVASPKFKFPIAGATETAKLAATVENLGAAAYLGQAGNIKSKDILAAALSIHSVEGRHAAALNTLVDETITPDGAFAKPATMEKVLADVQPFIVS